MSFGSFCNITLTTGDPTDISTLVRYFNPRMQIFLTNLITSELQIIPAILPMRRRRARRYFRYWSRRCESQEVNSVIFKNYRYNNIHKPWETNANWIQTCRFYNGVRTSDDLCQSLYRPTSLTTQACVLDGTGVSATPVTCMAYVAPVASPVAAPVAPPVGSKQSIGSIVFTSSILVLAASIVAFF